MSVLAQAPPRFIFPSAAALSVTMASDAWALLSSAGDRGFVTALNKLPLHVVRALCGAGLTDSGAYDTLSDLTREELHDFLVDLVEDPGEVTDQLVDIFLGVIAASHQPAVKRRRFLSRAPSEFGSTWTPTSRSVSSGNQLAVPSLPPPGVPAGRWPTRYHRNLSAAQGQGALAQAEELERERWVKKLLNIIMKYNLPIMAVARQSQDPLSVLRRSAGGKRALTLRKYIRAWGPAEKWFDKCGITFPAGQLGIAQVLDYLGNRAAEPCARTVPASFMTALSFLETTGGIQPHDQVSNSLVIKNAVKDIEVDLARGRGRARQKAPQFLIMIIVAFELYVLNESFLDYRRLFAWAKLLKVWASLRFDDLLRLVPENLSLSAKGLLLRLERSKSTGPGKRVEVVFAAIGFGSFLVDPNWISCGYSLLLKLAGHIERDYLLPLPDASFRGVVASPLKYTDSMGMSRALLVELKRPALVTKDGIPSQIWAYTDEPLLHNQLTVFWTEHGDRALLVSWAASLGYDKPTRDILGRWSPRGSDEYVRSVQGIAMETQRKIAAQIRDGFGGPDLVDEGTLIAGIHAHFKGLDWSDEQIEVAIAKLRYFGENHGRGRIPQLPGSSDLSSSAPAIPSVARSTSRRSTSSSSSSASSKDEGDQVPATSGPKDQPPQAEVSIGEEAVYLVSTAQKSGRKTLHHRQGCWRKPGLDYKLGATFRDLPPTSEYTWVCQGCWKHAAPQMVADSGTEVSSSSENETGAEA